MLLVNQFAEVLKIADESILANEDKLNKRIQMRLVGIGLTASCSRCGGSGHYSYCQMYGTTCFKCGGSGLVAQKLSRKLLASAKEAVEAGKLDEYFARLQSKRLLKNAEKVVLDAWSNTGIGKMYDWRKIGNPDYPEDTRIGGINRIMADVHKHIEKLTTEYRNVCWTIENRRRYNFTEEKLANLNAKKAELEQSIPDEVEKAIAEIKKAEALI